MPLNVLNTQIPQYSLKRYDALRMRYESEVMDAHATVIGYLQHPSHIGEHPQHTDEIDAALERASSAEDKLEQLIKIGVTMGIESEKTTRGGDVDPGFSRPIYS